MIPKSILDNSNIQIINVEEVSKTYEMQRTKLQGYVEEINALKQAIFKELSTEKYEYSIYSFDYGIRLEDLIGKDFDYVKIELKRRIKECLEKDSRILEIINFSFKNEQEILECTFDVKSIYGEFTVRKEVNI